MNRVKKEFSIDHPVYSITTNGYLITDKMISLFKEFKFDVNIRRIVSPFGYFLSSFCKKSIKSELLCVSLISGIASPETKSIAASRESVPNLTYS